MSGRADRNRPPAADDAELWSRLTTGIKPLKGPRRIVKTETPSPARPKLKLPPAPAVPPAAAGLDKRTAERFRKGEMPIDARLDLHGLTQDRAHVALGAFIARAYAAGQRCVIVVTGKGAGARDDDAVIPERRGVLKDSVPRWLKEPGLAGFVLAMAPAQARHGGSGALYVLLRRQRKP